MKIHAVGSGYNQVPSTQRSLTIDGRLIYKTDGRGLRFTALASDGVKLFDQVYDTYGSPAASDALATAISVQMQRSGVTGVLTSHDAWERSVSPSLRVILNRYHLQLAAGIDQTSRRPYAAVFTAEGGTENLQSTASNAPVATVVVDTTPPAPPTSPTSPDSSAWKQGLVMLGVLVGAMLIFKKR